MRLEYLIEEWSKEEHMNTGEMFIGMKKSYINRVNNISY